MQIEMFGLGTMGGSRQASTFGDELLSAMRRQFGGHAEAKRRGGTP